MCPKVSPTSASEAQQLAAYIAFVLIMERCKNTNCTTLNRISLFTCMRMTSMFCCWYWQGGGLLIQQILYKRLLKKQRIAKKRRRIYEDTKQDIEATSGEGFTGKQRWFIGGKNRVSSWERWEPADENWQKCVSFIFPASFWPRDFLVMRSAPLYDLLWFVSLSLRK